ncbi:MAG: thioredoxin-dependent thiol peroxidase [Chloroflexi bacterium]|nr:thioredoxin-dependent thiol peroxidase [Chloroflexota bacterium]
MTLQENTLAPDFQLPDQDGVIHKLSDYRGKPVVLYFYPKDNTPGCTLEATSFRDDFSKYEQAGAVILGISPDSVKSHKGFCNKFNLPFTLLADEDHSVLEMYGVWGLKKNYGKEYYGVQRTTYLIDENGMIAKVYEKVKPAEHSQEILLEFKL